MTAEAFDRDGNPGTPMSASRIDRYATVGSRFLWLTALPGVFATLTVRYLVPTPAEAYATWAAPFAQFVSDHLLSCWLVAFGGFVGCARYWSASLPITEPLRTGRTTPSRLAFFVVAVAALALAARVLLVQTYRVESASMLPTLEPDDVLAGSKVAYGWNLPGSSNRRPPSRGDIIVFHKPAELDGPPQLVKRVLGLPGDRVSMNGPHPVINGWEVPSCDAGPYLYPFSEGGAVAARLAVEFLGERAYLAIYAPSPTSWTRSYDVKPGEVFVLGDNRSNSSDSRVWHHGDGAGLPVRAVEARVDWWLMGVHRDQHLDFDHPLRPLELSVRLDGLDTSVLRDGIHHCLESRPTGTNPPEFRSG